MEPRPLKFIGRPIEAIFDEQPALGKKPGCPNAFVWGDDTYSITQVLSEWHDNARRGRMSRNMRSEHLATARRRGSWGVGRHYFRVQTQAGRIFDIYYDKAPGKAADRTGSWHLYREMDAGEGD